MVSVITKVLLLALNLRSALCLRGYENSDSVRRLGWQRVSSTAHHALPQASSVHVAIEEDHEGIAMEQEEIVVAHEPTAQHNDGRDYPYRINYYEYKDSKKQKSSKKDKDYMHYRPKSKSKTKYAYLKSYSNHQVVGKEEGHVADDYVLEADDYYEIKGGKPFYDDYYIVEKGNDDNVEYIKGNPKAYNKGYYYKRSKKSEKYRKDSKKSKHNNYYYGLIVSDDEYFTYSKSKKSKGNNRPHFPDFEYIDVECDYNDYYYNRRERNEGNSMYDQKRKNCRPVKVPKSSPSHGKPKGPDDDDPSHFPTFEPMPTMSPAPMAPVFPDTFEPTVFGSFLVEIPTYVLAYKLLNAEVPTTAELEELEEATGTYLSEFFFNEFELDGYTILVSFETNLLDYTYSDRKPVVVDYKSYARFSDMSTITPSPQQLGSAVAQAFTGLNMLKYEDRLTDLLPSNNIFVGSEIQYYEGGEPISDKARNGFSATGIAASAVAFTLLVAGFVIYKRKSGTKYDDIDDKLGKRPGDVTVAGDTVACETFDGTASVSVASLDFNRRYVDDKNRIKQENLGSIPEDGRPNSVQPEWDHYEGDDNSENENCLVQGRNLIHRLERPTPRSPGGRMFENKTKSASFEEVALQAPAYGHFQDNAMPDPSTSEDDNSQISESELSQFVVSSSEVKSNNKLEIKSLLSMDSDDENTQSVSGGLYVRDNSSRRLRTVAEIEAMLSSELDRGHVVESKGKQNRPRTVEEIESLLTAEENGSETIVELPFSDEDESIIE